MPDSRITIENAMELLKSGLSILPADLKKKCPCVKQWKSYQERLPTENEVKAWFSNKHDALCIVTGRASGNLEMIDFDNGGELFGPWVNIVEKNMPGLSYRLVIERSQSGGRHIVYRCGCEIGRNMKLAQGERNGKIITLIETRGDGGLFLCAPSAGYELLQGNFTTIPTLTENEREILLQSAWELNEVWKKTEAVLPGNNETAFSVRPGDDFNERADLRLLLKTHGWQHVHTSDESEYYRRPGKENGSWSASLKDNVFYVFSSNAQPFEPNKAYSPFSVYTLLEHNGNFTNAANALYEQGYGSVPRTDDIDISGIISNIFSKEKDDPPLPEPDFKPEPMPEELFNVPGFVTEVMNYTLLTAPYPNRMLAFAGALALQSHLAARKIEAPGGTRTNPYIIALAKSGSGKDHPRKVNNRVLAKIGTRHEITEKIVSAAGLEDALAVTPALFWQVDEFYSFLLEVAQDKSGAKELIMAMILMLFSSANTGIQTRLKAGHEITDICCPNLTILGSSTPGGFFDSLNKRMLEHGLFSRMTIFEADSRGKGQLPGDLNNIPDTIIESAKRWRDFKPSGSGNLNITAMSVPVTPDAEKLLMKSMERADERYSRAEQENGLECQLAVWSRVFEHILKYSLIYAASEAPSPEKTTITIGAVRWAEKLIFWEAEKKISMAEHNYHESEFARSSQKVIDILEHWHRMHGEDVLMPGWKFNRRIKGIPPNYLKAVIESLKNQERILIQSKESKGRIALEYGLPY